MIDIESIKWRNFFAYGDYETSLDKLTDLGPALIIGTIEDGDSNGAGKSTITNAILWCLFGKVFNKDRPGDNVINWFVGANCYVEIKTKDGWIIKRTRKLHGHDDLLVYSASGDDESRSTNKEAQKFITRKFGLDYIIFTSSAFFGQISKAFLELSDQARKSALERLLGLHRINAWATAARDKYKIVESRQEISRDKLEIAKGDTEKYGGLISGNREKEERFEDIRRAELVNFDDDIDVVEKQVSKFILTVKPAIALELQLIEKLAKIKESRSLILDELSDSKREAKSTVLDIETLDETIGKLERRRLRLADMDFSALANKHTTYIEANKSVRKLDSRIAEMSVDIRVINKETYDADVVIKRLKDAAGAECPTCRQIIDPNHAEGMCAPYYKTVDDSKDKSKSLNEELELIVGQRDEIEIDPPSLTLDAIKEMRTDFENISSKIEDRKRKLKILAESELETNKNIRTLEAKLDKIDKVLGSKKTQYTKSEIHVLEAKHETNLDKIKRLKADKKSKKDQENPYTQVIGELNDSLEAAKEKSNKLEKELNNLSTIGRHYHYLWRAYSDRRKIKSLVLANLIPFLNKRLQYYLDLFTLDIKIQFKDNLSIESNMWGYEYCSGGERKRIDLSIMFALYDLYLGIHGRQCNIMILDEVDGRLDSTGIEAFIQIVMNNFSTGTDAIMVISHRPEMLDAFPTKIQVLRDENRFAHIVEVA